MRHTFDRREFLKATAGALALTGGAFGPGSVAAQARVVRVTHFGGPYQPLNDAVGKPFEAAGFGKVEYTASLTPATMGQLQANKANPPYDVAMFSRPAG